MVKQGYAHLQARLPSNHGFDLVFEQAGIFTISEVKFSARWRARMAKVKNGYQMDEKWVRQKIVDMMTSSDPGIRKLGTQLDDAFDKGKIDYRIHTVGPNATSIWKTWIPQ